MDLKKRRENFEDKAKADKDVKMGRTTKKLLKSFITNLKTNAKEPSENSYAPFVQTDYEDESSMKNNNSNRNTDKKIRDLWENLKKQMGEYETKKDSQSK